MAAPKGNQYALGNNGGRPPIHTSPEDVKELILDYFQWIKGEVDEDYQIIRDPEPPTITGLTLHLGFADKSSLYDYRDKDEFSHHIKRAITAIEKYHEIAIANGDKCVGNIFALKAFGWKDSYSLDHTTGGEKISNGIDYSKLSTETLQEIADSQQE